MSFQLLTGQEFSIGLPITKHFTKQDYSGGTQTWDIKQAQTDFMFFANNSGIIEFDGANWAKYELPNSTIARSLAVDNSGRIYVGGQDEIGYLSYQKNTALKYKSLVHLIDEEYRNFQDVWKIFWDSTSNNIYFCTELFIFKLDNNEQISTIKPESFFVNFFQIGPYIYAQDKEQGIISINQSKDKQLTQTNVFADKRIINILPHTNGDRIVLTSTDGIYLWDQNGFLPQNSRASNFIKTHTAYSACKLKNGHYAIGSVQNGLIVFDLEGKILLHLNEKKGLHNNTVLSLHEDRHNNLWLGLDNGIEYVQINTSIQLISSSQGLLGTTYCANMLGNELYLGTNRGLFQTKISQSVNDHNPHLFKQSKIVNGQIWGLNKIDDVVIVCHHGGADYISSTKKTHLYQESGAWKFLPLKKNPNYALLGTYGGLILFQKNHDTWTQLVQYPNFLESTRIFEEDKDGNIWVSHTYRGLYKLSLSSDLMSIESIDTFGLEQGITDKRSINISWIQEDLLFTTKSGIYTFQNDQNRFILQSELTDLFGKDIDVKKIIEDHFGNIWFSIDDYFGVIPQKELASLKTPKPTYFRQVQEDLVNGFESVFALGPNTVLVGTENGALKIDLTNKSKTEEQPLVRIKTLTSHARHDSFYNKINTLNLNLVDEDIPSYANDFKFTYASPTYEYNNFVHYRVRLQGYDDKWSDWTPKTEKEYTNLPSGQYQLEVQSRNANGKHSAVDTLSFTVATAWHETLLAKLIYGLLGLLTLAGIIQYYSKKEKKITQKLEDDKERELKIQEESHKQKVEQTENEVIKLRNDKLRTDIKHKNSQLASVTMHLVQKNNVLTKIKNLLTKNRKSSQSEITKSLDQILSIVKDDTRLDDDWEQFEYYFDQVHENFFKRLRKKYPKLTPKDQKLCAYLRMNLSSKEIAPLLHISVRGVEISRYRLRKKLELGSEDSLVTQITNI